MPVEVHYDAKPLADEVHWGVYQHKRLTGFSNANDRSRVTLRYGPPMYAMTEMTAKRLAQRLNRMQRNG